MVAIVPAGAASACVIPHATPASTPSQQQHEDKPSTSNTTARPAAPPPKQSARSQLAPIKVGESDLLAGFDAATTGSPTHHVRRHKRQGDASPRGSSAHPLKKARPAAPGHRSDATQPKPASKHDSKHSHKQQRDARKQPQARKPSKPQPNSDSGTHAKTLDGGGNSSTAAASTRPDMQDSQSERKRPNVAAGGGAAAPVKAENVATSSQQHWPDAQARRASRAVPVQKALTSGASSALGLLNVNDYASYEQLRTALTRLVASQGAPAEGEPTPTLVYRDAVGDWLLLSPEEPWSLFQSTVQALMIM